jgi:hypothetical protein
MKNIMQMKTFFYCINKISFLLFFSIVFCLGFAACSTPPQTVDQYYRNGEVNCVQADDRIVTVQSEYTASSALKAEEFAVVNALENLLFKGVHNCRERALVNDESEWKREHSDYLDWLVERGEYARFVTERNKVAEIGNTSKSVTMHISFDLDALRKDMEQKGVLRKFGL